MTAIYSDEEFLESLYHSCGVQQPATVDLVRVRRDCEELVERGIISQDQIDTAIQQMAEAQDPAKLFRGRTVTIMRENALRCLPHPCPEGARVLLGVLPSAEYNAFALRGPFGTPIIVYNQGMLTVQKMLVFSILAFMSWYQEHPIDRTHSQQEYALTVLALAATIARNPILDPSQITTYDCHARPVPFEVARVAQAIEEFIILHEIGHVALGHIDAAAVAHLTLGSMNVDAMEYSQQLEYEADTFAAEGTLKCVKNRAALSLTAGTLFRFFDIIERFGPKMTVVTHPPGRERWNKIKATFGLDAAEEWAVGIDNVFDDCTAMFPEYIG